MKIISLAIFTTVLGINSSFAELSSLDEGSLSQVSGRSGITLNGLVDFSEGTRVSYKQVLVDSSGTELASQPKYFVLDNLTGSVAFEGLAFDLVDSFEPASDSPETATYRNPSLRWTMPKKLVFDDLKTDGLYISDTATVGSGASYLGGARFDGALSLPSTTKAYIFSTER